MKLLHTSDLHIGKRLFEYSLIEDQRVVLEQLLALISEEKPDALLISGDIYDKTVPSAEAVGILDAFLTKAAELTQVLLIAGNHDSPERISFGGRLMSASGVHVCGVYDGTTHTVVLEDAHGPVNFWLLPFVRPADVRRYCPETEIATTADALAAAIADLHIDTGERNVLLAHQFVTGADRTESEEVSVGGTDNVDAGIFADFDYTALGHIHRAQECAYPYIRYSGTLLPYSFSEAEDEKTVTVVELEEKGNVRISARSITPPRPMRRLRGTYASLMAREFYAETDYPDSYLQITLTDEEDIPDALMRLRTVYPFLMRLEYDNIRTRTDTALQALDEAARVDPFTMTAAFYEQQNGQEMTAEMTEFLHTLIASVWEGGDAK